MYKYIKSQSPPTSRYAAPAYTPPSSSYSLPRACPPPPPPSRHRPEVLLLAVAVSPPSSRSAHRDRQRRCRPRHRERLSIAWRQHGHADDRHLLFAVHTRSDSRCAMMMYEDHAHHPFSPQVQSQSVAHSHTQLLSSPTIQRRAGSGIVTSNNGGSPASALPSPLSRLPMQSTPFMNPNPHPIHTSIGTLVPAQSIPLHLTLPQLQHPPHVPSSYTTQAHPYAHNAQSNEHAFSQTMTHAPPPAAPSMPSHHARRHTTSSIGTYVTFAIGPLKGRTIRAVLEEVQKADLGRKCADPPTSSSGNGHGHGGHAHPTMMSGAPTADGVMRSVRKDRRPLDPPPVVRLRLFEGFNVGTEDQTEKEIPAE